ncbi:MAG TPA: hypothetical protein VGI99_12040, partial [Gemmataceae bacterium]
MPESKVFDGGHTIDHGSPAGWVGVATQTPEEMAAEELRERKRRHAARPFRDRMAIEGATHLERAPASDVVAQAEAALEALRAEADESPAVRSAIEARDALAAQVSHAAERLAEAEREAGQLADAVQAALASDDPELDVIEAKVDVATAARQRFARRIDSLRPLLAAAESNLERERARALPPLMEKAAAAAETAIRGFDREESALKARHGREWLALPWAEKLKGQLLLALLAEQRSAPGPTPEEYAAKRLVLDLQEAADRRFQGSQHRFFCSLP